MDFTDSEVGLARLGSTAIAGHSSPSLDQPARRRAFLLRGQHQLAVQNSWNSVPAISRNLHIHRPRAAGGREPGLPISAALLMHPLCRAPAPGRPSPFAARGKGGMSLHNTHRPAGPRAAIGREPGPRAARGLGPTVTKYRVTRLSRNGTLGLTWQTQL